MNSLHRKTFLSLLISLVSTVSMLTLVDGVAGQLKFDRNSTRKVRVKPGRQASRIGSAVKWEADVATAVAKSKATGKPVFWYVPTLRGSFMDRKTEIDRYMMAGPFSWPDIIEVLNEHYVPVKAMPTRQQQRQLELVPYVFIEPGFVIMQPDGKVEMKLDRLTTLHPKWFRSLLTKSLSNPPAEIKKPERLTAMWKRFEAGEYEQIDLPAPIAGSETAAEELLLAGMADFRLGNDRDARIKWRKASEIQPDHPLAWKAAAESEGFGPFVRGFEVQLTVPKRAMQAGFSSAGSAAPADTYTEQEIWKRSVDFLLGMQNRKGGFTDSDYDFGGTDSLPNVHVAVTALAGLAMLESRDRFHNDEMLSGRLQSAIDKAVAYVSDDENINRFDRDELMWAYAYRVRLVAAVAKSNPKLIESLQKMVRDLEAIQSGSGAWFHEYSNPFVTATALLALKEAQLAGAEVSPSSVERGLVSLSGDRFKNGAYPYSSKNRQGREKRKGAQIQIAQSAGRMPLCELGLLAWDRSSDEALELAIKSSFELNENLMVALKYDDHTSRLAYGGFFFWYDIRARSEAITHLLDEDVKARFHQQQRELILSLPEIDGCFVDSHELGRVYGTSMALLSLSLSSAQQE